LNSPNPKIQCVAIYVNFNIPEKGNAALQVADFLSEHGVTVAFHILNRDKIFRLHRHKSNFVYLNTEELYSTSDMVAVFGSFDENIRRIEESLEVSIVNRGTDLRITGDEEAADKAVRTLEGLLSLAAKGETIDEQRVRYLITLVKEGNDDQVSQIAKDVVCITAKGKPIKAKTVGQQRYMRAIEKNTITIGVGPAGTGKTYLAVAAAVAAFRERTVNRIVLTRPAVEER
jgi:phosphate starvation-inducible protein PhoH